MKTTILASSLFAAFVCVIVCLRQLRVAQQPSIVVTSQGPTVQEIERMAQILVSKVHVADVLIGESDDSKGAFLIRGDAAIAVDLNLAGHHSREGQ